MSAPLSLREFSLVSRVTYSILAAEEGQPLKACLFYSTIGAEILVKHYGIAARPVVGAALYRVSTERPDVLTFAALQDNQLTSQQTAFHAWVETPNWALDFMSPLFPEILAQQQQSAACPRRGFQRRTEASRRSVNDMEKAGDFVHLPNEQLTKELLERFRSKLAYVDLVGIARDWFRRPPTSIAPAIAVADAQGVVKPVPLLALDVAGFW